MTCRNHANTRQQLLQKINEVSFAVEDLLLYLDTHPCDEKAQEYFSECICERKKAMAEYAASYGPLTIDDAMALCGGSWKWMEQPFPWEQEGGCR